MAVDTRDKRFSLLGFGQAHGAPVVFFNPDGTDAGAVFERAQYIYLYSGLNIQSGQPTMRRWGGVPFVPIQRPVFGRTW